VTQLSGHSRRKKPHTLQTIHPSIQEACKSIEAEIEELEGDLEGALSEVQEAIGDLSDLRYGSFPKSVGGGDISEEVLATLKRLEASCEQAGD
jgi:centromere-localized protein 2